MSAIALLSVAAASTTACSAMEDELDTPDPDPLLASAARARADSAAARAAIAAFPASADTLTVIADQRSAHADALDVEIARLAPPPSTTGTTPADPTTASPVAPPTLTELSMALRESGTAAAGTARSLEGYRAGLLGSISAACTVASTAVS